MNVYREISGGNLTHILNESWINLHYVPAILTGTVGFVAIIFAEMREKVLLNIFQLEVRFVQFSIAFVAKPQQTVRESSAFANSLNHQPNAAFIANRTVWDFRRDGHHIART